MRAALGVLAARLLAWLERRGWLVWERRRPGATVLQFVNAWPDAERPYWGTFVRDTVDGLEDLGVRSDVLHLRGLRRPYVYLVAGVAMALLGVSRSAGYRLVHSHGGETALAARCYLGAPVLASYWGTDINGVSDLGGTNLASRRWWWKTKLVAALLRRHAVLLTATTTKSRAMELRLPPRARAHNHVIPDGVDRSRFTPGDRAAARAALGWPADGPLVISVGREDPLKRLALAEGAVALAAREVPGLRWRWVTGVPAAGMPDVYRAADVLVHTAVSEGSPNVVKEALACDTPVVATASGDVEELLAGVTPSFVCAPAAGDLARAIVACVRAGSRCDGRAPTERYGLAATSAATLALYRSLGAV